MQRRLKIFVHQSFYHFLQSVFDLLTATRDHRINERFGSTTPVENQIKPDAWWRDELRVVFDFRFRSTCSKCRLQSVLKVESNHLRRT